MTDGTPVLQAVTGMTVALAGRDPLSQRDFLLAGLAVVAALSASWCASASAFGQSGLTAGGGQGSWSR